MKMKTNTRLLLLLCSSLALLLVLGACYPNQPEDLSGVGVAVTIDNPDGNYDGLLYWAMPDTVVPMINPDDDSSEPLDRQHDAAILSKIAEQMAERGFIRVSEPGFAAGDTFPDVVVDVRAVQSDAWIGFIYYGYPYYGYPGYGWGYPTTGYYEYTQGTILWGMTDWRGIDEDNVNDPDNVTPLLWLAALQGALSGQTSGTPSVEIPKGIGQCFTQSTYIQATSR